MEDEFAGQRLPDLPTAGYATERERALTDEVMFFIRGAERNRLLLLTIVVGGKEKFRPIAKKAWAHLKADTELADAVFGYLALLAGNLSQAEAEAQLETVRRVTTMTPQQRVWGQLRELNLTNGH